MYMYVYMQFIVEKEEGKFTVDDGIQPEVTLISPNREVLVATFLTFVQDNIGERERERRKNASTIKQAAFSLCLGCLLIVVLAFPDCIGSCTCRWERTLQ